MKLNLKKAAITFMLMFAVMALPKLVSAGPTDGDPSAWHGSDDKKTPTAPIDGGLSLLVIAGVGYGIKRVKDRRKKTII